MTFSAAFNLKCSMQDTGIGGLLGQVAAAPPACSDNGGQTARLRLVRSKIFRAPGSVRCVSETEPRKTSASVENRAVSKLGVPRSSRAAAMSTPTKACSGWNKLYMGKIEPRRSFKKRGKQLQQTRFEFGLGHAVAFKATEIALNRCRGCGNGKRSYLCED
jgi:hypothetical protein